MYNAPRLDGHRLYGHSGYMVNFCLVPNEMAFHTIRYPAYMVFFRNNFGYMVNFLWNSIINRVKN